MGDRREFSIGDGSGLRDEAIEVAPVVMEYHVCAWSVRELHRSMDGCACDGVCADEFPVTLRDRATGREGERENFRFEITDLRFR